MSAIIHGAGFWYNLLRNPSSIWALAVGALAFVMNIAAACLGVYFVWKHPDLLLVIRIQHPDRVRDQRRTGDAQE